VRLRTPSRNKEANGRQEEYRYSINANVRIGDILSSSASHLQFGRSGPDSPSLPLPNGYKAPQSIASLFVDLDPNNTSTGEYPSPQDLSLSSRQLASEFHQRECSTHKKAVLDAQTRCTKCTMLNQSQSIAKLSEDTD
jgi:hypothetical protein